MMVLHLWLDAKIKVGVLHVGSGGCCLSVCLTELYKVTQQSLC